MVTLSLDEVVDEKKESKTNSLDGIAAKTPSRNRVGADRPIDYSPKEPEYDPTDSGARQRRGYEKPGYAAVLADTKLLLIPDKAGIRTETTATTFSLTSSIEKKDYDSDKMQPEKKEAKYDAHQVVQTIKAVIFEATARTGAALPPQAREQVAAAMNCQHDGPVMRGLAEAGSGTNYNLSLYIN